MRIDLLCFIRTRLLDLNQDCHVDFIDLEEFANHWLESTAPSEEWVYNQGAGQFDSVGDAVAESQAALALVDQLVRSLTDFEMDPIKFYAARERIALSIERLAFYK